jgi:hypothetical protein
MLVSFKVGAHLALLLFGACEADTGATATAEPRPDDAPASASPAPGPPQRSEQAKAPAPEPDGDHAEQGGVYLELTVPKPRYWLGEPVTLVASVVNGSSEPVPLYPHLHPEFGFLDVRVTGPGGKPRTYYPPARREGRGAEPVMLAPGERRSDLVPLFFSSDGWFLTEAGGYEVEASFAPEKEPLVARPVRFEIRAPEAESDREAARFLMEPGTAGALYRGPSGPEELARLEKVAEAYPESQLAPYAHLALGRYWNREAYDRGTKAARPADPKRALRSLELAAERVADPLLWTESSLELADCYELLGDDRADEARDQALRRFPEIVRTRVFEGRMAASGRR